MGIPVRMFMGIGPWAHPWVCLRGGGRHQSLFFEMIIFKMPAARPGAHTQDSPGHLEMMISEVATEGHIYMVLLPLAVCAFRIESFIYVLPPYGGDKKVI